MVHLYNELLLSNEKEHTTDTHKDMDKPQMHHAWWEKPVSKDSIQRLHVYDVLEKAKL